eukprot:5887916-Amphidinium_carterae.1
MVNGTRLDNNGSMGNGEYLGSHESMVYGAWLVYTGSFGCYSGSGKSCTRKSMAYDSCLDGVWIRRSMSMNAWTGHGSTRSWSTTSTSSRSMNYGSAAPAAFSEEVNYGSTALAVRPVKSKDSCSVASVAKSSGTAEKPSGKTPKPSETGVKPLGLQPKKPTSTLWKDVQVAPRGVPYPDPKGMKSRPYDPDEGRLYPHLEENRVEYRSENGTYPKSCIPRFCDVLNDDGASFPVSKLYLVTRERRRYQERRAFFEGTLYRDPD